MLKTGIYLQLAPVLFGNGTIAQAGEKAKEIGITKALIVSDAGIEASGLLDKLTGALDEADLPYVIWAKAQKDCPDYTVCEGAAFARENGVDGTIGFGGGSVLDAAKAIAAVAVNGDQILKEIPLYISFQKTYENPPLPVLEITTGGTGSESTFVTVITSAETDSKIGLPVSPSYSIVDPELSLTVPQYVSAFAGTDILAHATESLTEQKSTPHSDLLAYETLRLVHENLPKVVADGTDLEARTNMAFGSNLSGISFNESGIHVGHACAHALGHVFDIDHGVCCASLLPGVIRFISKDYSDKVKKIGEIFEVEFDGSETPEQIGEKTADAVIAFVNDIGILKTFEELGLSRDDVRSVAERANDDYLSHCYAGEITLADIDKILSDSFDDYAKQV